MTHRPSPSWPGVTRPSKPSASVIGCPGQARARRRESRTMRLGMSRREAAKRFGIHRNTITKMLSFSVPPGFLAEVRGMPQRNLAVELFQKLLKGELGARRQKNVVQAAP